MNKIRKEFIPNPDFDPAKVANASSAAEGLCKWCLAMEIYDRVAKVVAPKKERLKQAEQELAVTMKELNEKRALLKAVEEKLANLKSSFQEMTEKKEKLEFQVSQSASFRSTNQRVQVSQSASFKSANQRVSGCTIDWF